MVLQHLSCVSKTVEKSLIAQHGLTKKRKKHVIWNRRNSQSGNLTMSKLSKNRWWNHYILQISWFLECKSMVWQIERIWNATFKKMRYAKICVLHTFNQGGLQSKSYESNLRSGSLVRDNFRGLKLNLKHNAYVWGVYKNQL